jgi:hypothetical protein
LKHYQPRQWILTAAQAPGIRGEFFKSLLILHGFATPDGSHPTGRRVSVLRSKVGGAILLLTGLAAAYFFILRPIEDAKRTGVLDQGPYGLFVPIIMAYGGVATLLSDLRDEKSLRAGADGRLYWTRRGLIVLYGLLGATLLTVIAWYLYVRSIGLSPFRKF